ncbi:ERF family protein [[Clostridium] polysaccharolyticum]|uniref:ERF superfamily protein n=1 Tax=[Clostridium] polysaccharolyticum TaxID=29364 RepID=A0A1H9YJS9_9FIRM|nr:ERF family protein [[Clostridium] polysaccharolyticum]SES69299.1 ERF superfamily protein [[Clostridium] polysaccharolyticum]
MYIPAGHPDEIKMDIAEIIKVVVDNESNIEEKKGNDEKMAESRVIGVHKKLAEVQRRLVAPKNQYNSFGKYKYRSCEDILEGVKPLLSEVGATLIITDEIVPCGDKRVYVKATATFTDVETQEKISNSSFAREEESKKGMDASQVTGATSSYARKYALNGLFCIDDNKDPDTEEFKNQQNQQQVYETVPNNQFGQQYQQQQVQQNRPQQQSSQQQPAQQNPNQSNKYMVETVRKLCKALNVQEGQVLGFVATKNLETMTVQEFDHIMQCFKATPGYSEGLLQQ